MGAGKTAVGTRLAQRLGWNFYDLDEWIEHREQMSIAQIFYKSGETAFRKMESVALTELLQRSEGNCVIALGGGAFVEPGNRKMLEQASAVTVLLSAPVEELQRRCQAAIGMRPLAGDAARFRELFAARQQAYALAQFRVETGQKEIAQVAREIEEIVRKQ